MTSHLRPVPSQCGAPRQGQDLLPPPGTILVAQDVDADDEEYTKLCQVQDI